MNNQNKRYHYVERLNALVPGGAHTYSKGNDQFAANAPKAIVKGKGCTVWDVDDKPYTDFAMSLGSVLLGHAHAPVLEAVRKELLKGSNFCRPSIIEGQLAEKICEIIPSAEMVKFGKHGSDVVTAAVKLSRAYTGRKYVARCSADPFNAVHDWFISSTEMNAGIPEEVSNLTLKFKYNDLIGCQQLVDKYPDQIACFILEPLSFLQPENGFLEALKELCEANSIVLIFDEVVSGFRFDLGGAQNYLGVFPHLSAFGKGMANGFSISALVGKADILKLAGLDHADERVFVLSSTHGGETHSYAAALACIDEIEKNNLIDYFWEIGAHIIAGINNAAKKVGAERYVKTFGYSVKPGLAICDENGCASPIMRTFFIQETIRRGILIPYIVPGFSHKKEHVDQLEEVLVEVLTLFTKYGDAKSIGRYLNSDVIKPVFRKFN